MSWDDVKHHYIEPDDPEPPICNKCGLDMERHKHQIEEVKTVRGAPGNEFVETDYVAVCPWYWSILQTLHCIRHGEMSRGCDWWKGKPLIGFVSTYYDGWKCAVHLGPFWMQWLD